MKITFLVLLCVSTLLNNQATCLAYSTATTAAPTSQTNTCSSCADNCQAYNISREGGRCKCDADCDVYGDCCGSSPTQRPTACSDQNSNPNLIGLRFTCHSVYLDNTVEVMENEAFWMVSSCPDNFLREIDDIEHGQMLLNKCLANYGTLPPVTDIVTGIVYKNEYCIACNEVENPIIAWQTQLGCTSNVYKQLGNNPTSTTIAMILETDPEIFQRECKPCLFSPPSTLQPPRACFPVINNCLNKTQLELEAGRSFSQQDYERLTDQCLNGIYDLHGTISSSVIVGPPLTPQYMITYPIYQNFACAQCNADNNVTCFSDKNIRMEVPVQCIPEVESTSSTTAMTSSITAKSTTSQMFMQPTSTSETQELPQTPAFPILSTDRGFPDLRSLVITQSINININRDGITHQAIEIISTNSIQIPPSRHQGIPFTISLSNLGGGQVRILVESEQVNVTLDCPEGQAPVGFECRDTLCPEGYLSTGGRCFFHFKMKPVLINANSTIQFSNHSSESGSGFFLDCPTELVLLNNSDFTQITNSTIFVHGKEVNVLAYSKENLPLICPRNTSLTQVIIESLFFYPPGFLELTYAGCSLSAIGCVLILVTYGLFKELRTLPTKVLMNLAFAILVVDLLFLVGSPVSKHLQLVEICTTIAICLHFFFLAQFAWMSATSFEMVRKFYKAKRLALDTKKTKRNLLIAYTLIAWGLPLAIVTSTVVINFTTSGVILYGVTTDGSLGTCWINHMLSTIIAFVAPLVFAVFFNLVMFIAVTVFIITASLQQSKLKTSGNKIPFLRLNIAIFITTPLPWIFGFIAILVGTTWAWYPFIILNSSQGFIIFIAFLLTKRTLKLYCALFSCCKRERANKPKMVSSMQTTTGNFPTSQTEKYVAA